MSCGKPVVYIGPGEGGRLVKNANAGFVLERGDPDAIAEAICQLAADPRLAQSLGRTVVNSSKRICPGRYWWTAGFMISPAGCALKPSTSGTSIRGCEIVNPALALEVPFLRLESAVPRIGTRD